MQGLGFKVQSLRIRFQGFGLQGLGFSKILYYIISLLLLTISYLFNVLIVFIALPGLRFRVLGLGLPTCSPSTCGRPVSAESRRPSPHPDFLTKNVFPKGSSYINDGLLGYIACGQKPTV